MKTGVLWHDETCGMGTIASPPSEQKEGAATRLDRHDDAVLSRARGGGRPPLDNDIIERIWTKDSSSSTDG